MPALGYRTVCLCPLSSVHSCCHSISSLSRTLLSSWWEGEFVALAHILAVLLLRGSCPSVSRCLPPGLCGGFAGPGFTWACSPRHITAYCLETGPWAMLPRLFSYHPPTSHGMSRLEVCVCIHNLKCCLYYFLEILDYISSESLVPSLVAFDSFSSSAPGIYMPGLIRKRGWECWSASSSTSLHGS